MSSRTSIVAEPLNYLNNKKAKPLFSFFIIKIIQSLTDHIYHLHAYK